MAKDNSGMKIFPKLLLTMLLVALIPLAGLWYNVFSAQKDWEDNMEIRLRQASNLLANQVANWVNKNERALQTVAMLEDINSMDPRRQKPVLATVLTTYEWSYLVHTMNREGKNVSRSDNKDPKNYGDREYFRQVANGQPFGYQVIVSRTTGRPALGISAPIFAAGSRDLVGVISLAAHLVDISEAVADVKIGKTGFAMLLDKNGKVIAHGNPEKLSETLQDLSDHPAFREEAVGQQIVYEEGGRQIVAYSQQTDNKWTLIVQQDYDDAFAPLLLAKRNSTILLVVSLSTAFFVALLFGWRLVKPLESLTKVADGFSRGGLDAKIPETNRGDEIGALARAIERMGVSIKMAFNELKAA